IADTISDAAGDRPVVGVAAAAFRAAIASPSPARLPAAPDNPSGCAVTNDTDPPPRQASDPSAGFFDELLRLTHRKERLLRSDSCASLNHRCASRAEKIQRDIQLLTIFKPPIQEVPREGGRFAKSINTPPHFLDASQFYWPRHTDLSGSGRGR